MEEENVASAPQQYAVNGIVFDVGKGNNIKYIVRWYGYSPDDNKVEPPAHIPERYITRFLRWVRKQDARRQRQRNEIEDKK